MFLLSKFLYRFIRKGRLQLYDATGRLHQFGGVEEGPDVTVRLHDSALYWNLALDAQYYASLAYVEGTLTLENCQLRDFLMLVSVNRNFSAKAPWQRIFSTARKNLQLLHHNNPIKRPPQNVARENIRSNEAYQLLLGEHLQYSLGHYKNQNETSEQAQQNALRSYAARLKLEDGMRIVEMGCGWGGLALYLSQVADVEIVAITHSSEQQRLAQARADALGVSKRVQFKVMDYRKIEGRFDRVVATEMLTQVGVNQYDVFCRVVFELLKPEGFGLICGGAMRLPLHIETPVLRKHMASESGGAESGGPVLSQFLSATERQHLWVCDIESLRYDCSPTIASWQQNFIKNRGTIAEILDERFCRLWELWLARSELAISQGSHVEFCALVSPIRDAVPILRDYIADEEAILMKREKLWNKNLAKALAKKPSRKNQR
jgi:cyclopropane-fatty-acyl-phospholipid synthase